MKPLMVFGWFLGLDIIAGTLWIMGVSSLFFVDIPSLIVVLGLSFPLEAVS